MSDTLYKLPLFSKPCKLKPLPGADPQRVFMITDALRPQPEKSMGYVVESAGGRNVKILAWLAIGGAIYACNEPLAKRPDRESDAGLTKDEDGTILFYLHVHDKVLMPVQCTQRESDGRLTAIKQMKDLGPYGEGAHDVDEMAAACYITQCHLLQERGELESMETIADVLDTMVGSSYADVLDALVCRGRREGASDFERYASQSLVDAGAEAVRPIAAAHDVDIRRLSSTGLFWTGCDKRELTPGQIDTLQAVEGALNRLVFMGHELGDGVSPLVGGPVWRACERAAVASLATFARDANRLLRACDMPSDFKKLLGIEAARGGEWDVRTRFAAAAEQLRTPFSFEYLFDCDAAAGVFGIEVTVPAAGAFPAQDASARNGMRNTYLLRLSMALAAMAFGAGVGVIRAIVTVRERGLAGRPLASIEFSRQLFTMETMPHVQTGALLDASLPLDDLVKMLAPLTLVMQVQPDGELLDAEPIAVNLPDRRIEMAKDTRPLPEHLVEPLRARTVQELDIFDGDDDPLRDRYRALSERVFAGMEQGSTASGEASEVLDLIAAYDAAEMLEDDEERPLYCANMIARVSVGLFDEGPAVRYRKIPDTAYDARSLLCRLYRDQGNTEDAIRLGQDLVRLAPTSFSSYHTLALSYREADKPAEAARAILDGMRVAVDPNDIACGYYRLGFLFWQGGDPSLGLACYAMVPRDSFFYGETQAEMRELMQEAHLSRSPNRDEAKAVLRSEGVPVAPVSQLRDRAALAAIGLVDAGVFDAAAPIVHFMSMLDVAPNSFDVLASVRRSLVGR